MNSALIHSPANTMRKGWFLHRIARISTALGGPLGEACPEHAYRMRAFPNVCGR